MLLVCVQGNKWGINPQGNLFQLVFPPPCGQGFSFYAFNTGFSISKISPIFYESLRSAKATRASTQTAALVCFVEMLFRWNKWKVEQCWRFVTEAMNEE